MGRRIKILKEEKKKKMMMMMGCGLGWESWDGLENGMTARVDAECSI
jgi:hypothetical protein